MSDPRPFKRHYDVVTRSAFPHHWLCGDTPVTVERHGDTLIFTSHADLGQPFSIHWPMPRDWDGTYGFYEHEAPLRLTAAQYTALRRAAPTPRLASA